MSRANSPSANKPYGVAMVCEEWEIPRSTFYAAKQRASEPPRPKAKRGPKPAISDEDLTAKIREVLTSSVFVGEGHRKVWARLRHQKGVRTSKARVLRLMREARLLAVPRGRRVLGPRVHDGRISTDAPDVMWATDGTSVFTTDEGHVTVFVAIDHCTAECVGIHAAKVGDRFEALEPIRQGIRTHYGLYDAAVACGLSLRHDHGSQYMSDYFQEELRFLGIASSPAFVRAPEGNGCCERFIRTLKEQLLWLLPFRNTEELNGALRAWAKTYNEQWLVARHGYRTPAQIRNDFVALKAAS